MSLVLASPYRKRAAEIPVDPNFGDTALLLHLDGDFTDVKGNTITANGSAVISTTQKKFGSSSARVPPSAEIETGFNTSFNITTGDFTTEAWFYFDGYIQSASGGIYLFRFVGASGAETQFFMWGGNNALGLWNSSNGVYIATGTHDLQPNQWVHAALVRSGSTFTGYLNGVAKISGPDTAIPNEIKKLKIGGVNFDGYIDEVRHTPGVARYLGNFTPPTNAG